MSKAVSGLMTVQALWSVGTWYFLLFEKGSGPHYLVGSSPQLEPKLARYEIIPGHFDTEHTSGGLQVRCDLWGAHRPRHNTFVLPNCLIKFTDSTTGPVLLGRRRDSGGKVWVRLYVVVTAAVA